MDKGKISVATLYKYFKTIYALDIIMISAGIKTKEQTGNLFLWKFIFYSSSSVRISKKAKSDKRFK